MRLRAVRVRRDVLRRRALAKAWGRPGTLPIRDIFDAADAGDPHAVSLRDDLYHGAAAAVRVLVLSADVERVVIGEG